MKQAMVWFAVQKMLPRLKQVRTSTWLMLGAVALLLLGLFVWLAFALVSWLWGQAGTLASSGREAAGTAIERVGEVAPELKSAIEPWTGALNLPQKEAAPVQEVSGIEPVDVARYPGFVRVFYQRQPTGSENRYTGAASLPDVAAHYRSQLEKAGYRHEILLAEAGREQHQFTRTGKIIALELKADAAGKQTEVILKEREQ